jgi:predicted small metal-binding protein
LERGLACLGAQAYAPDKFEAQESVLNAGVFFSLPALTSQGLHKILSTFNPLPAGFYGLHHIILLMCFMALCRIKNPEQLKQYPAGELGKLLGLDRIPQVEYLRTKIYQITLQSRCDQVQKVLFDTWVGEMDEPFFYMDGHVRVYSGSMAKLPKHYVSREKLCLSATSEFYVNTFDGLPLMVIMGELNEKLKVAIEKAIIEIKKQYPLPAEPGKPLFTLVFDREAYEPEWFKTLWDNERIAVITYRKNVKDNWDETLFNSTDVEVYNNHVLMRLCEMGSYIQKRWFREIRKLSGDGHQTSIITTHPTLDLSRVAAKMFSRWTQENFFKYMIENFDFDRMIEYGTQELAHKETKIPNPEYNRLTQTIKKLKEKKGRLQAQLYQKMEPHKDLAEELHKIITCQEDIIDQINTYQEEIQACTDQRKGIPSRIRIDQMPVDKQYNMLKQESKKLKNIILMMAYRAESSLYGLLPEFYANARKDGRQLLKDFFTTDADLIPDYPNNILRVRLHSLATPRANQAVKQLCNFLNQSETYFPTTNLKLTYESVAP